MPAWLDPRAFEACFPPDLTRARRIQRELARRVRLEPLKGLPGLVAAVDAWAPPRASWVRAGACLYRLPDLACLDVAWAEVPAQLPYVPGFLSFREGPAVLEALSRLTTPPDLILFDGQGIAHPRRLGIAAHLGVLLDRPTVGCAKSRLVGEYKEPAPERGAWTLLHHQGDVVGAVVRTRTRVRPVFVSPGHRVDLEGAVAVVLACTRRYRLPEPIRMADRVSRGPLRGGPGWDPAG